MNLHLIRFLVFTLLLSFNYSLLIAQSKEKPTADELFDDGDYVAALTEYQKQEKKSPNDDRLKDRLADCYLNLRGDKTKAIPYLKDLYNKHSEDTAILFKLAMAYKFDYNFKNAVACFNNYRLVASPKQKTVIDKLIETCEVAKEMMKHPVAVTFENLGPNVNTKYPDYYPFVTKDEKTLYFTTRRDETMGSLKSAYGYWTSDIYFSVVEKGEWTKAKSLGVPINTSEDEECVGITPDGKNMIIYEDKEGVPSELLHTEIKDKAKAYGRPVLFNEPINSKKLELEGCYSSDVTSLYFVSDRKGGLGGADIYISHRLPNGEWGTPQNLGENINTSLDEGFPFITEDGQTLYFASKGHTGMGGFDIFKSRFDSVAQQWQKPVNIGYPVNTPDDDLMFSLSGRGRDGYLSTCRKDGLGDLDIYKVVFTEIEQPLTAIRGAVQASDTTKKEIDAYITITNTKTNEELDAKNVNPKTGRYIFIVEPGKYAITITGSGFKLITREIIIYDKSDFTGEVEQNFTLEPDTK